MDDLFYDARDIGNLTYELIDHPTEKSIQGINFGYTVTNLHEVIKNHFSNHPIPVPCFIDTFSPALQHRNIGLCGYGQWEVEIGVDVISRVGDTFDVFLQPIFTAALPFSDQGYGPIILSSAKVRLGTRSIASRVKNRKEQLYHDKASDLLELRSYFGGSSMVNLNANSGELTGHWSFLLPKGFLTRIPDPSAVAEAARYGQIGQQMRSCFEGGLYTDFKIICHSEGASPVEFPVHRAVLAASPVFRAMFDSDMKEKASGECTVTDIEPTHIKQMLDFLYGKLRGEIKDPVGLYLTADKYDLSELKTLCRQAMRSQLSAVNALDFYKCAKDNDDSSLLADVIEFIASIFHDWADGQEKAVELLGPKEAADLFFRAGQQDTGKRRNATDDGASKKKFKSSD